MSITETARIHEAQPNNPFNPDKLLRFPEALSEWMRTGYTGAPIVVDMDLTNKCPHNCPQCPGHWQSDPDAQLSAPEAIDYIHQFSEMGTKCISFGGGGDPLAHPDCAIIVETASRLGMNVAVITNAANLSDAAADKLAGVCDWIRISLDAATPETFARTHGVAPAHFDYVCKRIERLASIESNAIIGVGFLTDASTMQEMADCARLVKSLGADYIQYRPYNHDLTDVSQTIRPVDDELSDESFTVCASWAKYREMTDGYTKPYTTCHFHHFGTVVNARGEVHLCCDMRCPSGYIGSLRANKARDIWNDRDERLRVAKAIDLSKCPPLCRGNGHNILLDRIATPILHEVYL